MQKGDGWVESLGKGAWGSSSREVYDGVHDKSLRLNHHVLYIGRQVLRD